MIRTDLPRSSHLAQDIVWLEREFGTDQVFWDSAGKWMLIQHFPIASTKVRYNHADTYLLIMVPHGYGERRGFEAGLEEAYIRQDLRVSRGRRFEEIPHTYGKIDRRGGEAVGMNHRYLCTHIDWDPKRHCVQTCIDEIRLFFQDPSEHERRN